MKNVLMVLGIALIMMVGCGEEQADTDQGLAVLHQEYMEPGTDEPYNGERNIHNEALNLKGKAIYVDGYPEEVTYYNSDDQKKTEIVVADKGKGEVVRQTEWYKSGQKKFEHHKNTLREWYENGQLRADVPYDENGDLHGIAKTWDEDGNLKEEESYEHGTLTDSAGQ
ncbi:MAG: toxin-antitoxin system YwqK family antitoxin [Bacteroidota bacterium]